MTDDLCLHSATEQLELLRSGACSARELIEAHLERIERVDPTINAVVTRTPERALAAADAADARRAVGQPLGPLGGLPVAHKDLVDTAGVRTTYGSPVFADWVPESDALVAERLRAAGAIMIGKTNTPEFGAGSHTFNPVFGATRNPWNPTRSAGGSSGGAAAALAARLVPLADGSDLGGSLRNPAAWNGVYGLRPTPGVVPSWPSTEPWTPYAVEGPMARTAGDLALLLAAMSGPDPRVPLSAGHAPFAAPVEPADLSARRAAWSPTLGGLPVESDVLDALEPVVAVVAGLLAGVEADEPDLTGADTVFETYRAYSMAAGMSDLMAAEGDRMKATLRWNIERGQNLTTTDLMEADALRAGLHERAAAFFATYDYLLAPVTQLSAFPIEWEYPQQVAGAEMGSYLEWMRSCSRITTLCCPVISIPAGLTAAGLPVGLQVAAAPFCERQLIQLALAIEHTLGAPPAPLL